MPLASLNFTQRHVHTPLHFTAREYLRIAARTIVQTSRDNVSVVAAGVAFFALLSMFPLISALLSVYGYFADVSDIQAMSGMMEPLLPEQAWAIIAGQIEAVVSAPNRTLSVRIIISLLLAFYTAGAGIRALLRAMNVAYNETERRGVLRFTLTGAAMTLGLFVFIYATLFVVVGIPAALRFFQMEETATLIGGALPWVVLIGAFSLGAAVIYRFGPSRRPARKRWVMPGVIFTTLSWLGISWGFSFFVRTFGQYEATYGGLSAVIVLLLWFWLTAMTVIVGAEINAEMERQTLSDTTRGPDRLLGQRGARMADFLTVEMREKFPDRFPYAPSLRLQTKPPDPTPPELINLEDQEDEDEDEDLPV